MATTDELKKKDGSAVGLGAVRLAPNQNAAPDPRLTQVPGTSLAQAIQSGGPQSFMGSLPATPAVVPPANAPIEQPVSAPINQPAGALPASPIAKPPTQTGGASGSWSAPVAPTPAAPAAAPSEYSRQMGEVGNFFTEGAATALKTLVSAPGYGFNKPSAPAGAVPPAALPSGATAPVTTGTPTQAVVPPAGATPPPAPPPPATAPADGTQPSRLNGVDGVNVGYGATRFDLPGKAPLFTNMTDATGLADNAKLMARGAVTAQNQTAMDGIQGRQDARDQSARNKMQYDAEVAAANATNEWQANQTLQNRALAGNRVALNLLNNKNADQTARRGQDIQAGATRDNYKLAQDKLKLDAAKDGRDATNAGFQNRSAQRLETLQAAYEAAKPEDRAAIAEQLRVMTGKDKPAQWKALALQGATDSMGNKTEGVLAAVNEQTGEVKRLDQGKQAALPSGMVKQIGTSNGQPVYEDANGKRHF